MKNTLMPIMRGSLSHMIDSPFNSFIDEVLDNALPTTLLKQDSFPKYNIKYLEKPSSNEVDNTGFVIEMALAGWTKDQFQVYTEEGTLYINSLTQEATTKDDETVDKTWYYHRGISNRSFSWSMSLPKYAVIKDTSFENGLLSITVKVEVPEEQKRKLIEIK